MNRATSTRTALLAAIFTGCTDSPSGSSTASPTDAPSGTSASPSTGPGAGRPGESVAGTSITPGTSPAPVAPGAPVTPRPGAPVTPGTPGAPGPPAPAQPVRPAQGLDPVPGAGQDEDLPVPEAAAPVWDAASQQSAQDTATRALTAFARPGLDETTWWADLAPLLSTTAATAYAGTDPAAVPAQVVTGPAVLFDQTSVYLAGVDVPTDAGTYRVLLSREDAGTPWLVERLTPPATTP